MFVLTPGHTFIFHTAMARYSLYLFVLKMPLNTNQPVLHKFGVVT